MAKLYFYYSSMNAGKSTNLLQSSYNYKERGMNTLVLAPLLDDRFGAGEGHFADRHRKRCDDVHGRIPISSTSSKKPRADQNRCIAF